MEVEWTRCSERLPEKKGQYWIYGPWSETTEGFQLGVELAGWESEQDAGHWWIDDMSFVLDHDEAPTHWANADVPEPPEEGGDAK